MKKSTKIFSMFLALVMVFTMLGTTTTALAVWDDEMLGEESRDYQKYMQFEGNVLVKYTGTNSRVINVPRGTEIGEGAFKDHTEIREVHFNVEMSKIGKEAFKGCTNLEDVFAQEIYDIGDSAFEDCHRLQGFSFATWNKHPSYYNLGKAAFKNCTEFRAFLGDAVNWGIKEDTFKNCPKLKYLILNGSLKRIDPTAFNITNNDQVVGRTTPTIFSDVGGNVPETFAKKYGMKFVIGRPTAKDHPGDYVTENAILEKIPVPLFCCEIPDEKHPYGYRQYTSMSAIRYYKMVDYNYVEYKYAVLRDVAAECSQLDTTKFNIEYMPKEKAVNIIFGEDYVPNGSEYEYIDRYNYFPDNSVTKMPLYFNGQLSNQFAYNIGGRACVILKDLLQKMNAPYQIAFINGGLAYFKVGRDTFKQVRFDPREVPTDRL